MREKTRKKESVIQIIKCHPWIVKAKAIWIITKTAVIMALQLALLLSAFALIWGRVFAPALPDGLITKHWELVRSWNHSRQFMSWLRSWTWYPALCHGFRDVDGSLSPLLYLLGFMGSVGFATSAINEIKSHRSMGMLMSDVIRSLFPLHMWIQVVFHSLLALVGWYACTKNVGIAAAFCCAGLLVSSVYSLLMARAVLFSDKVKKGIVTFYMKDIMRKKLESTPDNTKNTKCRKSESNSVNTKEAELCVLDYAIYLGQQWNQGNILQIHRKTNGLQEKTLIHLATCALSGEKQFLKNLNAPEYAPQVSHPKRFKEDFDTLFPDAVSYGSRRGEYVLFTKGLHFMDDQNVVKVKHSIQYCSQIWEQLFTPIQNDANKARLAWVVLKEAWAAPWVIFSMMVMGLLKYLGLAKLDDPESELKTSLQQKIGFLYAARQAAKDFIFEEKEKQRQCDNNMWSEILFITAALFQWMDFHERVSLEIGEVLICSIKDGLLPEISSLLEQDLEIYVVMAYLLFSDENEKTHSGISAYMMRYLEPEVRRKLRYAGTH